ncbi:MAG: hydantoinase B/oxoprolinase family protein, partial [Acidisphaera sp.]|nr:hydantoinase B/oxoprolinase family protein [Acidisphaera sp.]
STLGEADQSVISYICDRERAVVWGINGGLPSMPHGLSIRRAGAEHEDWLGSVFSDVPLGSGDVFSRPTAGGGGYGDPLERDPALVREDVADDYVSLDRARKDYGVVLRVVDADLAEYAVDEDATQQERARIRAHRRAWATEPPAEVARRYQAGELDRLDVVRQYAVILDWATGQVLEHSTAQYREMFQTRAVAHWLD